MSGTKMLEELEAAAREVDRLRYQILRKPSADRELLDEQLEAAQAEHARLKRRAGGARRKAA